MISSIRGNTLCAWLKQFSLQIWIDFLLFRHVCKNCFYFRFQSFKSIEQNIIFTNRFIFRSRRHILNLGYFFNSDYVKWRYIKIFCVYYIRFSENFLFATNEIQKKNKLKNVSVDLALRIILIFHCPMNGIKVYMGNYTECMYVQFITT